MMGQFRASYGHTLEFGGSCKGKWAYLFENVNTAHSLDFNYHLISTESTTILSGSFQDDPVLYGKNARRTDEMTFDFHWENIFREQEVVIEGKGKCDFYGPYLVKGRIFLDAQARRGHIRMVKLDPSQAHLLPNNNKYHLSQRENLDITVKHCLPGCCCRLHQNAAASGQEEKEEDGNKDDENSKSSSSPIKMNSDSEGEEEEEF